MLIFQGVGNGSCSQFSFQKKRYQRLVAEKKKFRTRILAFEPWLWEPKTHGDRKHWRKMYGTHWTNISICMYSENLYNIEYITIPTWFFSFVSKRKSITSPTFSKMAKRHSSWYKCHSQSLRSVHWKIQRPRRRRWYLIDLCPPGNRRKNPGCFCTFNSFIGILNTVPPVLNRSIYTFHWVILVV